MSDSVSAPVNPILFGTSENGVIGLNRNGQLAEVAEIEAAFAAQNTSVLVDVEARLTREMGRLIISISESVARQELISKELPDGADFCKLVTSAHRLICLQFANALGKGLDKPILFDDGRQYLADLELGLGELFREVELDGRRFQTVALIEERLG